MSGHVKTQNDVREGFISVDALHSALEQRVASLENFVENFPAPEGGGGGETSTEWFLFFDGSAASNAVQPDAGDTITINGSTYTFHTPSVIGEAPDDEWTWGGANQLITHAEVPIPGNQNNLYNILNAIVYLIFNTEQGIEANLMSPGTTAPAGSLEIDLGYYSALNSAIIADSDQSEGPWPPLRISAASPFAMSLDVVAVAEMRVATSE